VVAEIAGVPGAHGVVAVPELGRVYATATDANQVAVIDATSLSVVASVPAGQYPDGIVFDADLGKLYVSDETGGTDTVIDASTNQVVATIDLGGEVGNTVFDPGAHQILAAVQTRNQIVAIDPNSDTVSGRYDTPGCDHPHGLVLDPARRLLFVGCENNARMAVFDLSSHSILGLHDVGNGPDVLAFDPGWNRVYVAAESGPLSVFEEADSDVRELARGDVGPNAHSIAVDPQTHHLFTPIANLGGGPVLRELATAAPAE
jgi:YVTN family beta-propeller protein